MNTRTGNGAPGHTLGALARAICKEYGISHRPIAAASGKATGTVSEALSDSAKVESTIAWLVPALDEVLAAKGGPRLPNARAFYLRGAMLAEAAEGGPIAAGAALVGMAASYLDVVRLPCTRPENDPPLDDGDVCCSNCHARHMLIAAAAACRRAAEDQDTARRKDALVTKLRKVGGLGRTP